MWQWNFEPKDTVKTDHLRSTQATIQLVILSVQHLRENAAKYAQDKKYSEEISTICDKTMRAVCFQGDLCSHQPPYLRLPSPITLKWMPATLFILSFILCIICMIKGEPHALSHQPELKGWNRCTAEPSTSTPHSERTHTCPSRLYKLLKQLSCCHSWRTTWGKNHNHSFRISWDGKTSACVNLPFMPFAYGPFNVTSLKRKQDWLKERKGSLKGLKSM